jgi:hypothetical protein
MGLISGSDEKLAAQYPDQRASLPVKRLQHDGSLHTS